MKYARSLLFAVANTSISLWSRWIKIHTTSFLSFSHSCLTFNLRDNLLFSVYFVTRVLKSSQIEAWYLTIFLHNWILTSKNQIPICKYLRNMNHFSVHWMTQILRSLRYSIQAITSHFHVLESNHPTKTSRGSYPITSFLLSVWMKSAPH